MLTVKHNHAKPPNGGHRFPNGDDFHRGETVEEILKKIEDYRAENALPLGNPEHDLGEYYQSIAPYLVQEVDDPEEDVFITSTVLAESIMRFWRDHPPMLPADDAIVALRQKICEECRMRTLDRIGEHETARPYYERANRRAILLTSDRNFNDRGWCRWSDLPIGLICRVKKPGELEGLPPAIKECWVRAL